MGPFLTNHIAVFYCQLFVEAIIMESDSNPPSQSSEMDIDDLDVMNEAVSPPQKKQQKRHTMCDKTVVSVNGTVTI